MFQQINILNDGHGAASHGTGLPVILHLRHPRIFNRGDDAGRSKPLAYNEDIVTLDDIVLQTIENEGSATRKELRRLLDLPKDEESARTQKNWWTRFRRMRRLVWSRSGAANDGTAHRDKRF